MRLFRVERLVAAAALLALAAACGGMETPADSAEPALEYGIRVHMMPVAGPQQSVRNTAGPHLSYFGGPVVSNAKVVQVIYGSGTYLSSITGTQIGSFYNSVLNSNYVDWPTPAAATARSSATPPRSPPTS